MGYVWPVNDTYDVFIADADGSNLRQLTTDMGYDAEATVSPVGDRVVFTSMRNGDLDLYSMNLDGTDVRQLTDRIGYDGGAFFSPDGSKIVWRAHYPEEGPAMEDYQRLLAQDMLRPGDLEVWVMDADGSNKRQLTELGGANFAPYWHPDGDKILFRHIRDVIALLVFSEQDVAGDQALVRRYADMARIAVMEAE